MRLSTREVHGTPLIRIEGDVDPEDAPGLQQAAWDAFGWNAPHIILDLEDCNHISSTGLGVLFSLVNWARSNKKRIIGISPSADILRLFQIVRLTDERGLQLFVDLESAHETILGPLQGQRFPRQEGALRVAHGIWGS